MSRFILDSSAILAVLQQEIGGDKAATYFPEASVSTVNVAEVLTKLVEKGNDIDKAIKAFEFLQIHVIDLDESHARKAAELRPLTKHLGLSIGDRCCLALAILEDATAITADRDWKTLSFCPIDLIR